MLERSGTVLAIHKSTKETNVISKRACYTDPGTECQCVDRSELIGAIMDAEGKLVRIEEMVKSYEIGCSRCDEFMADVREVLRS